MKIISKFQDYYDSVIAYGVDESIYFKRKQSELLIGPPARNTKWGFRGGLRDNPHAKGNYSDTETISGFRLGIIGFCGQLYPYTKVRIKRDYRDKNYKGWDDTYVKFFFNFENFFTKVYTQTLRDFKLKNKIIYNDEYQRVKKFFEGTTYDEYKRLFLERKVAIFDITFDGLRGQNNLILNPCLKEAHFQEVKDPFTAFMEISNYISGVLGVDENPTVNISDENMKEAKGFYKYSFKTLPTKHKK